MPSQNKWDKHWLDVAEVFSQLSKDNSTKVGAVLVSTDNRQCSGGYNGFAAGMEDDNPELWERPLKYELVIHAEMNAIMNCPFDTKGCSIYVTHQPCHRCMVHMINAGIKKIVYSKDYTNLGHGDIWRDAAITIGTENVYQFIDGKRIKPKY